MKKDIILHGDVYSALEYLEDNSVALAITSPPYWKQRDYGFEGQIGQEKTPEEYIGRLVAIFNKLFKKLRQDGIFFLNVGDKYLNRYGKSHLLQIPYRLAYHMTQNGWCLEDIIIWHKPNHMPSSVRDRLTNTYEPILVLAKSRENIYKKGTGIVEIPLQFTKWKHTAVYPEALVRELLNRVRLRDEDTVLDHFAGTGTTAVVVRDSSIHCVMIEKSEEFVDIIKSRTNIKEVIKIEDRPYSFSAVEEQPLPSNINPYPILENKNGEVYIAKNEEEFLSVLVGMTTKEFRDFHTKDAVFFFGVKEWDIQALYYPHIMLNYGYVLRNMIVVVDRKKWFPVFMFVKDKAKYRFYLDRVRIAPKTEEKRKWVDDEFVGMKVVDSFRRKDGYVVEILDRYKDFFPKMVVVKWNDETTIEFVMKEEILLESTDIIQELEEINLETRYPIEQVDIGLEKKRPTSSKFASLDRINWGASPGARKLMLGEYFTKMRLYKIEQPLVAEYLTLLRKSKNMSIKDVIERLPRGYHHKAGHWFRKDFGGSIPTPDDVKLLRNIFGVNDGLLKALEKTALKLQTVKTSAKGKNPGDYFKIENLEEFLKLLI